MESLLSLILFILASSTHARLSVMYAHDKVTDMVAEQCLTEMYPKARKIEVQESDEPCIIFCVLKKFGIMSSSGTINLDVFRKRMQLVHQVDVQRAGMNELSTNCMQSAEATQHKQDVCRKAKVFNDCTHLYKILLK